MSTHLNRVSGELPIQVETTEIHEQINGRHLNPVSHISAPYYRVIMCILSVNRIVLAVT